MKGWKLGIDVGGTFTDLTLVSSQGEQYQAKVLSTPDDPSRGVIEGFLKIRSLVPDGERVEFHTVNHGTTVATNAILEGKGARVALLVSEGYRDVLQVRRSHVPGGLAGWIVWPKPKALVSLEMTLEVPGRISTTGVEVRPFNPSGLLEALAPLKSHSSPPESICVSLINSFANPSHERATLQILTNQFPGVPVTLSSDLLPEIYEYERTVTTAANAYVRPMMEGYLNRLERDLGTLIYEQSGVEARNAEEHIRNGTDVTGRAGVSLQVLRSDGGLSTVPSAIARPVNLLYSGPAGGVCGAIARVAKHTEYTSFMTVDIGGTSADVCLIENGVPQIRRETVVGDLTVRIPSIDVRTVGSGGGSLASVPPLSGALRVGPESAGAAPGPACYGRGGKEPTVSDAYAVLGYLPPNLLGGSFKLNVDAAHASIQSIANALGFSGPDAVYQAAEGIIRVSIEKICGSLRSISVEKGFDPRRFALVAFGGAGGLAACFLAEGVGAYPAIVPPSPGVLCAFGDASTSLRIEAARTFVRPLTLRYLNEIAEMCARLVQDATESLQKQGVTDQTKIQVRCEAEVRYHGQATSLPVKMGTTVREILGDGIHPLANDFKEMHTTLFTFALDLPLDVSALRAIASEVVEALPTNEIARGAKEPDKCAMALETRIYLSGQHYERVPIWDRKCLKAGNELVGPCIITEMDSTTLVLPYWRAEVHPSGNILIWPFALSSSISDVDTRCSTSATPSSTSPPSSAHTDLPSEPDPITLQLIESSLLNARLEMDALIQRVAMSPAMREQLDYFPMIAEPGGRMVVGQFGSFLREVVGRGKPMGEGKEGDVWVTNDPYAVEGAISHLNDMLVTLPVFYEGRLIGWCSNLGHFTDIGGSCAGTMPNCARSIFEDGVQIPLCLLYESGRPNNAVFKIIERNSRAPSFAKADLHALVAACRTGAARMVELAKRFGPELLQATLEALLERNRRTVGKLIETTVPDDPITFVDYIDDDGNGTGPWKVACTMTKVPDPIVGKKLVLDFDGTDPQSDWSINFYLSKPMMKMFASIYLLIVFDPQTVPNDGSYDLIEIRIPEGTLLAPIRPAALSCRTHLLGRIFDILGALFGQRQAEFLCAAGYSDSPHLFYSAWTTRQFIATDNGEDPPDEEEETVPQYQQLYQIGFGGIPARPFDDGPDGHSLWPSMRSVPNESLESQFALRVERYETVIDSGGAGRWRGGNGMRIDYVWLEPGTISIHDDRWLTKPWGVHGGEPGTRSRKTLVKASDGSRLLLGSKLDSYAVDAGDRLEWVTWGGGGWGDALERPAELVAREVREKLVSMTAARNRYGVVIDPTSGLADLAATYALRTEIRKNRGDEYKHPMFNRGGTLKHILESCELETGLPPPRLPSGRLLKGPAAGLKYVRELHKRRQEEDSIEFGGCA